MTWFARFRRTVTRGKPRALFAWFLAGFAIVILLSGSFTLYSVLFFSDRVKDEVIQYNTLLLDSATEDYEKQFQLVTDAVLLFSMSLDIASLNKEEVNYPIAMQTRSAIQNFLNNTSLRIDNLILFFGQSRFALDKTKGGSSDIYFSRYLRYPDWDSASWLSRFEQAETARYLPNATISEFDGNGVEVARYRRMPIVIRNHMIPDFILIALVDADPMYESFFRSVNDNFYIRDSAGRLLYSPANADPSRTVASAAQASRQAEGEYLFQHTGSYTKFTYSSVITDANIVAKTRWESYFIAILAVIVLINAGMSLVFAFQLRSPVKRMIEALRHTDAGVSPPSKIKEFSEIQQQVNRILQSNRDIRRDLTDKQTILRQYAVIDKFKRTRNSLNRYRETQEVQQPFRIVLFQVHYTDLQAELGFSKEHATPYIKEIIDFMLKNVFPESLSLQIESQLIISVLFGHTGDEQVRAAIDGIVDMMGNERDYCFLTIGIGLDRPQNGDLTEAYEAAVAMLETRTFDSPNQIVAEPAQAAEQSPYSLAQEDEFERHLAGGNRETALSMIDRTIRQMKKRQAQQAYVVAFADNLAARIDAGCTRMGFNTKELRSIRAKLGDCHTYEQLRLWFDHLLQAAAGLYDSHRIKRDPIIAFVGDYIEANYASAISLDLLADKLDISRSYLSTYFKEKTGMYFVDYVNSIRIRNVLPLLVRPGAKIQDVAASVGYLNINSFNRIFKKMTGVTPSEYRINAIAEAANDRSAT